VLRGTILGALWGLIVVTAISVLASLSLPLPGETPPQAGQPVVPEGSEFGKPRDDGPARLPGATDQPERGAASRSEAPPADTLDAIDGDARTSAAQPETGSPDTILGGAPDAAQAPAIAEPGQDEAVLPNPRATAPDAPGIEPEPNAATDPASPPRAEPGETVTGFPSGDLEQAATGAGAAPPEDLPTPPAEPASEPNVADQPTVDPAADPASETPTAEAAQIPVETEQTSAQTANDTPVTPEASADEPQKNTDTEPAQEPQAETNAEPSPEPSTMPGRRAVPLTERNATEGNVETETPAQPEVGTGPQPAIEANAQPFDNSETKPILSIILIDEGQGAAALAALGAFPYPISFAVPVDAPDAGERMARYRAAGHEVVALVNLPENATAGDVETAASVWFQTLPETVAIMEDAGKSLQSGREVSEQLAQVLLESGHGLILYRESLDTARNFASRAGVPAATIFRDLDGQDQSAAVIRRILDNAAFRAGQEGAVVMVGRMRAETISALLLWGLADRADRVALAPASAALLALTP
jgi:polysaccharide deacetylase 2 family uncharacterized protein YibQ